MTNVRNADYAALLLRVSLGALFLAHVSVITVSDVVLIRLFDGLPTSASRTL
ncbi:hypothetical protein [Methylosinus sp. PW1]|uniref:hypothetical protein n=1 Tax=Methylosinus sp. PW1 TaxID=107636 RepID=UPI000B191910|nr:hypothetical protein [Methylosinus sp. PW1]